MKRIARSFLVFLFATAWCSALIPWTGFNDPDAFYHAKAAQLILQHGPIQSFPWLDLTLLGTEYADLHFGFHLFTVPFVAVFGIFQGLRIASVILAGLFLVLFEGCLRWLGARWPLVWTTLLLLTYPLALRLTLGKATPLALIWFVLGLTAAMKRKPWIVFLAASGFALSHGGWPFLVGSVGLLALGDALYSLVVSDMKIVAVIKKSYWREVLVAIGGIILGLLIHPNAAHILPFSWAQIVTVGLGTPYAHVILGKEWLPAEVKDLAASYAIWIIAILLGLTGFAFTAERPLREESARRLTGAGILLAVFTALTFKSRRNTEYLAPVIALWCGLLWSLVDVRRCLRDWIDFAERSFGKKLSCILPWILIACVVGVVAKQNWQLYGDLNPPGYSDAIYRASIDEISHRAQPGDRVFHSSWDEFPMLFAADDRLRYISGMDPTFIYIASSTLSEDVKNLTWGMTSTTQAQAWELIHDRTQSRFVFISKKLHQQFLELIESDPRYFKIADASDSAAFEVSSTAP